MTARLASKPLQFLLNGRLVSIDNASTQSTLLDVLRDRGLTGAKEGCAEGECGACMVLDVAVREGGSTYRAINSCLMFVPQAAGREIYTVEALASEVPDVFNVDFLKRATDPDVVFGSKAVGEPPLMLAISVREAIRDAIAAFGNGGPVDLPSPATPERIFFAIRRARELRQTAPAALAQGALRQ